MGFSLYVKPNLLMIAPPRKRNPPPCLIKKERTKTEVGKLSTNSQMKIKNAIRWLIACSDWKSCKEKGKRKRWRINMLTLTFHENFTDDNAARIMLSRWLEVAKYRWNMNLYLWKAEPQERGAIHFHISSNVFVPHAELRYTWNRELRKFGLVNVNDNSTDVHAILDVKAHENYLAEYFLNDAKHEGRRPITGKLWGCAHALSQCGKEKINLHEDEVKFLQQDLMDRSLYKKILSQGKEIPEFLKFNDIYLTGEKYYSSLPDCPIKQNYFNEISYLKKIMAPRQKVLFQ
jgi:hypothetical protein